jgi:hypothetical protein
VTSCLPCLAGPDEDRRPADYRGIACARHYARLEPDEAQALDDAIARRHPNGGRVRTREEQIDVVWVELHAAGIAKAWDLAELEVQDGRVTGYAGAELPREIRRAAQAMIG